MRADLDEKRSEYVEFDAQVTVTKSACVMKDELGRVTRLDTHFGSEMTMSQLYDAMIDFEMVAGRMKLSKLCVRKRNICKNKIGVE
jgi:hypothetical protein